MMTFLYSILLAVLGVAGLPFAMINCVVFGALVWKVSQHKARA